VSDGKVTAQTEYEATRAAASRATEELEAAAESMRAIDPAGYESAARAISKLEAAIDSVASSARIEALAEAAGARLKSLAP